MYKMTISGLAAGQEIVIDGLGVFSNGTYKVSARSAEQFRSRASSHNPKAPTLLEAFKNHQNINVEVDKPAGGQAKPKDANDNKGGDK